MRRLDEAIAVAAGETMQLPLSAGWARCYVIAACEGVGDFARAAQWCETMEANAERHGSRLLAGQCRTSYGSVLGCCGDWDAADPQLRRAVADFEASRPLLAGIGAARLGELRARQGRVEEARALFERADPHPIAVVGLGALALRAGDPASAADAAERVLRRGAGASVLARVPALELLARARAAVGELDAAAVAVDEVAAAAAAIGTPYLHGRARLAAAELAVAGGAHEDARRAAEDAVDAFAAAGAPYDAALARIALARALAALGRSEAAAAQAAAAREVLAALGAARDAVAAAGAADATGDLSPREREVLRLVAEGLGDAEIADRLVLSPHTVHRHVANVRAKLRQPSRAAAAAAAARRGLI